MNTHEFIARTDIHTWVPVCAVPTGRPNECCGLPASADVHMPAPATADRATARKETGWYVDRRPLDVLLPHVPGFEVVSDEDAEWKCIARSKEIGHQISDAVNSYTTSQKRIEALTRLIIDSQKPHGTCYWGLGFMFAGQEEVCANCAARREMKALAAAVEHQEVKP